MRVGYNLCVGLQRRLGVARRAELKTLRSRLFSYAAVFSRTHGKPALKLAVATPAARRWWLVILQHFAANDPNRDTVEGFDARSPSFCVKKRLHLHDPGSGFVIGPTKPRPSESVV